MMDGRVRRIGFLCVGATGLAAGVPYIAASSLSEAVVSQHMFDGLCSGHSEVITITRVLEYIYVNVASCS